MNTRTFILLLVVIAALGALLSMPAPSTASDAPVLALPGLPIPILPRGGGRTSGAGNFQKGFDIADGMHSMTENVQNDEQAKTAIGESIVLAAIQQYPLDNDLDLNRYITLVGLTLAAASPDQGYDYVFGLLATDEVHVFSTPSSHVLISRGAIRRMHDESELAGVLAHEITHIRREHGIKSLDKAQKKAGAIKLVAATNKDFAGYQGLADVGVEAMLKTGYEQPQEFEADQGAVQLTRTAGYDPDGLRRFLATLEDEKRTHPDLRNLMSTHPGRPDRIKRLSAPDGSGARMQDRFEQHKPK